MTDVEDVDEEIDDGEETTTVSTAQLQPTEIRDFVNSLKASAVHWFNSFYPDLAEGMSAKERHRIDRLNRIGMVYFRPLVMAILKNEPDVNARVKIFDEIERFALLKTPRSCL